MVEKEVDIISGEIPNVEMESMDYLDEGEKESEAKDAIVEDDSDTEEEDDAEAIDDDLDEDSDVDDDDSDDDDSDEPDKVKEEPKTVNVKTLRGKELSNKDYKEASANLTALSEEFEYLDAYEKPTKPKTDQYGEVDEEALSEYRTDLALWKRDEANNKRKAERLQDRMRKTATKAQNSFLKDFPEARANGFEQFVAGKRLRYLSWTTGERSLYSLYREHLEEQDLINDTVKVKQMKKDGVKIKPTSHKKGSAAVTRGNNGFSSKYKYANMPMFKAFAKEQKRTVSNFTKRKLSDSEINDLCKQEYKLSKGLALV